MENRHTMATVFSKKDFDFSVIYKLTSPSGKIYIGQSQCMYKRFQYYRRPKASKYLKRAILKYGLENMKVEILERNVPLDELDKREQFYFDTLKPFGDIGYNICQEAGTTRGRKRPPEEMRGSIEASKKRKGKLNHFYGKTHSEESLELMREARLGKKQSKEHKEKISAALSKCIKQIDIHTREVINEFNSIVEASKYTGLSAGNISIVANKLKDIEDGESITCSSGGYLWIHCNSKIPNNTIEIGNTSKFKKVKQINLKTKEVLSEFKSVVEASRETGVCANTISKVARKKKYYKNGKEYISKSAGGYGWEY